MQRMILRATFLLVHRKNFFLSYAEDDSESNILDWYDANKFIIPCNIQGHCIALILDVSRFCDTGSMDLAAVQLRQHLINSLTHYMSFYFNTFDSGKGTRLG